MKLQRMEHTKDDFYFYSNNDDDKIILTHVVNQVSLGGEFTVCGRAITDSSIKHEGFEKSGVEFDGSISDCNCLVCKRIIYWFKRLK